MVVLFWVFFCPFLGGNRAGDCVKYSYHNPGPSHHPLGFDVGAKLKLAWTFKTENMLQ